MSDLTTSIKVIENDIKHISKTLEMQSATLIDMKGSYATKDEMKAMEARILQRYEPTKNAVNKITWLVVSVVVVAILALVITQQ